MLQRLLFIALTLCTLTATAQWQQTGSKVRYVNGLGIPTKDTAAGVAADSSQILIRPADSSLYIKYKRTWVKVGSGGTIGGSGTTNYVAKFTAGTTLGNSQIFDNGTNVGVGTASPGAKLQTNNTVSGLPATSGTSQPNAGFRVSASSVTGGILDFGINGSNNWIQSTDITDLSQLYNLLLNPNGGNVGIGYTAPAAKLAVSGTTLINTNTDNGVDKLQVSGSMNVSTLATTNNLSVTTNATVGGTATIVGDVQINGLIGVSTTPQTYAIRLRKSGNNIIEFGTQSATNYSRFLHSSSTPFGAIGNASGAGISGGSNDDFAIGTASGSNNIIFHLNAVEKVRITSSGRILANTTTDNGVDELQVNGSISGIGFKQAYVTKTGAYTATNDDYVIDCTSGTFTVTLPASSGRTGRILIIKNSGAGTITVDGNASETIDGAATYSLSVQYATVQIMSDGTNWKIIAKF